VYDDRSFRRRLRLPQRTRPVRSWLLLALILLLLLSAFAAIWIVSPPPSH
jgi:hypothetical protein